MEEQYYADRVQLRVLLREHPTWTNAQYAEHTKRSVAWVKKWKKRLQGSEEQETLLWGQSRRPHRLRPSIHPRVVERILALRRDLPATLGRVAGPLTIIYHLQQDEALRAADYHLPTSSSTVHRILSQHDAIYHPAVAEPQPWPERTPLQHWQMDFKDISSVKPSESGKQQHVVESLNFVDEGTSLVMGHAVRDDFTMETVLVATAALLEKRGVPRQITFDRDTRFVGAWSGQDFPTPFVRFWLTLGVEVTICPPQRPDRNAFVERYHGSYKRECLRREKPADLAQAQAVTARYVDFYNHTRPHQGRTCGNQPPSTALAARGGWQDPAVLPIEGEPDRWLHALDGYTYTRRLSAQGTFKLNRDSYYVQMALAKQYVSIQLDAKQQELVVWQGGTVIKRLPIKGLHRQPMSWHTYCQTIAQEARTHWRTYTQHHHAWRVQRD